MVPFRILALGGGGTKGFLHIGALQELEVRVGHLTKHFTGGIYGCSIGSIIAAGIAFGLNTTQMERLSKTSMNLDFVFNDLKISTLAQITSKKGMFSMDSFEKHILSAFDLEGVDLRNKVLNDAQIPLFMVASNMTKGIPTIFKGNVPVLSAIKASCCIPLLFQPQVIGKYVYIDGGLITNDMFKLIPKEHQADTLSIYLIHSDTRINPQTFERLSLPEFTYKLYKTACLYNLTQNNNPNILSLYYPGGSGISTRTDGEQDEMIFIGKVLMRNFLSKNSRQECFK